MSACPWCDDEPIALHEETPAPLTCWRGECRNGCYYADACNLTHTPTTEETS